MPVCRALDPLIFFVRAFLKKYDLDLFFLQDWPVKVDPLYKLLKFALKINLCLAAFKA